MSPWLRNVTAGPYWHPTANHLWPPVRTLLRCQIRFHRWKSFQNSKTDFENPNHALEHACQ